MSSLQNSPNSLNLRNFRIFLFYRYSKRYFSTVVVATAILPFLVEIPRHPQTLLALFPVRNYSWPGASVMTVITPSMCNAIARESLFSLGRIEGKLRDDREVSFFSLVFPRRYSSAASCRNSNWLLWKEASEQASHCAPPPFCVILPALLL